MTTAFTEDQYETCYPPGIEHHWWNRARSAQILKLVKAENSENAVFLEVGCGRGLEVRELRNSGVNVYGVELADVEPLTGVEAFVQSGIDAVDLSIEERSQVTGILLLDVIEHLPDPQGFLKKLESCFVNLSVVIIAVPASQEIWSNYDVFYGHYRRYSTAMLKQLGDELAWERKRSGYFFHLVYIPARLLSWFGKDRQTVIHAPKPGWRWLHKLISVINRLDNFLVPGEVKGTSAYAVYRVKAVSS